MPFKKKLSHFWDYYKIHTIAGLITLLVAWGTVAGIMNRVVPDLAVGLFVSGYMPDEDVEVIKEKIASYISTEEDPKTVEISALTYDTDLMDEIGAAIRQKYIMELSAGEGMLYIVDEVYLGDLKINGIAEKFAPIGSSVFDASSGPGGTLLYAVLPVPRRSQAKETRKMKERENAEIAYEMLISQVE